MQEKRNIILLLYIVTISGPSSARNLGSIEHCIDYYKTGMNFDLATLQGEHYAVYFWPPNQRDRDTCAVINYKKLPQHEFENTLNGCNYTLPSNSTVIQATYVNNVGKNITLLYHGDEEVKYLYRSCNRISRYIYIRLNDNYVLGINCSVGGRGVLLSKNLPSDIEVQSIVKSIDFMGGREGASDCKLRPF
ncbi:uncharacterized protein LOC116413071 [Galleria mellonella]|uniref:Uncharacterized protein LOC116413071 n=1 Tax=Galleria mellonella TaxID=7137 RepID=A0A6J3BWM7_GALME|nr:uncharacterized protein LOC116413071 [Galleria mellonella]